MKHINCRKVVALAVIALGTNQLCQADWLAFPQLSHPHGEGSLVATTTASGTKRLYMVGGLIDNYEGSDKMEVYDFAHGRWTTIVMPANVARDHVTAVNVSVAGRNELWIIGGKYGVLNTVTNQVDVFNLDSRRFNTGPDLPVSAFGGATTLCGTKLVYASGAQTNGSNTRHTYSLDLTSMTPQWNQLNDYPTSDGLVHGGAASLGGLAYIVGGEDAHNHFGYTELNNFFSLNPVTGQYSTSLPSMPVSGSHIDWCTFAVPASAVPISALADGNTDGYICFAAPLEINVGPQPTDSIYAFDITNQVWRELPMGLPHAYISPGLCVDDEFLYVAGGGITDYFNEGHDVHRILLDELFGGVSSTNDRPAHTFLPLRSSFTSSGRARDLFGGHDALLQAGAETVGNALVLDGVDDRAGLTSFNLNVQGGEVDAFTMGVWFEASDVQNEGRLFSKTLSDAENDHILMLSLWPSSNGTRLRMRVKTNGTTHTFVANAGNIQPNTWYCAMVAYDGSELKLYLEYPSSTTHGVPVGTFPLTGTVKMDPETPSALGANPSGSKAFSGRLSAFVTVAGVAATLQDMTSYFHATRPF